MKIESVCNEFKPKYFEILDFYGDQTCFLWHNHEMALFAYNSNSPTIKISPIIAPNPIKSIHSYLGRVFLVCKPCGIYKFTKSHEFALLSASGLVVGVEYYEVFIVRDNCLLLENKRDKTVNEILVLSNSSFNLEKENDQLNFLTLTSKLTHENLKNSLFPGQNSICLISNKKKLYKLCNKVMQIIYDCFYNITDIIPVNKDNLTLGIILKTNSKLVVFIHVKNNKLMFKKIHLNIEINSLCVGFLDNSEEIIRIIYSDGEKIYYAQQSINLEALHKISWKKEEIICCKIHNNNIIAFNSTFHLGKLEFNITTPQYTPRNHTEFQIINNEMLKGSEIIVENISKSAKQLEEYNKTLEEKKEILHRINICLHKQKIPCVPKINVDRSGHCIFIKACFEYNLPRGSFIVANITCQGQKTFSSKLIEDNETTVEVLLKPEFLDSSVDINFDLVTFAEEKLPWCIVKDCLKERNLREKQNVRNFLSDKKNFLNTKLTALKNLLQQEGQIDEKKVIHIKKSLRREIPDI